MTMEDIRNLEATTKEELEEVGPETFEFHSDCVVHAMFVG